MDISQLKTRDQEQICREFGVKELYVFGSVVSGTFTEARDLDFLVVFNQKSYEGIFDRFMGLKKKLEENYQKPVDLLILKKFRNPEFQEEIDRTKMLVYAA